MYVNVYMYFESEVIARFMMYDSTSENKEKYGQILRTQSKLPVVTFQLLIIRYNPMNFNGCSILRDPHEEVDKYLRCESKWIIHHSTCSSYDWDQIGNKTCYILKS